jgi:outer membrane protein TolC
MQRFEDYERKNKLYNGVPFGIGYSQPIFKFNNLKWEQKIQPLLYNESKQAYIESMEAIAYKANGYFFDLLLAQVNLQVSETNLGNTQNILRIANEKFELGKISRNEILQLTARAIKSEESSGNCKADMEIATLNLRAYTGLVDTLKIALTLPGAAVDMEVTSGKVLAEAYENRSDAIAFARRIAEAKRDVAKAKGDNGLNAQLTAQLGFSKSATTVPKVYQSPQDQQQVQLTFTIPDFRLGQVKIKNQNSGSQFTICFIFCRTG